MPIYNFKQVKTNTLHKARIRPLKSSKLNYLLFIICVLIMLLNKMIEKNGLKIFRAFEKAEQQPRSTVSA